MSGFLFNKARAEMITLPDLFNKGKGRVWLCGGQSNMETPLGRVKSLLNRHIHEDNRIHIFQAEKGLRFDKPAENINGKWQTAGGECLDSLFAVPYFFARALLEDEPTPIALINIAAGGTPIEGWLPEEIVKTFPTYYERLQQVRTPGFVEEKTRESEKRVQKWHEELTAADKGLSEEWYNPEYDDGGWGKRMLLDNDGLDYGAVWFRKNFFLENADGIFTLNFGRVVDSVKVYINGHRVVSVDYQYPPCTCTIPEEILQTGENLIAVRVVGEGQHPKITPGKKYELISKNISLDLSGEWKYKRGCSLPRLEPGAWFFNYPCGVYNYMLAPALGLRVDGVIWYQGESNTQSPHDYGELFTRFINHLRACYGADLPVIYTQLANFIDPNNANAENWAILREQQRNCLKLPNTAMAVTIDCGEWNDLHPLDKKTVGERLALCARRLVYKEAVISDGPVAVKAIIRDGWLTVYFEHGRELKAKNGRPLLDLLDAAGDVHRVYAEIKDDVLVAHVGSFKAERVRFGWTDNPSVVLYNAFSFPASPFELVVEVDGK
jgi:sialate O-acetylesterase